MGRDEVLLRLGQRATRRPMRPMDVEWPVKVEKDGTVTCEVRTFKEGLGPTDAFRAFRRVCRGRDVFRLSCHSNSTIGADGIGSVLRDWEREGWVPDVVVADYADIMAPPSGVRETLDQIDETWKRLRRLSQDMHCLVVTATQSSAAAYSDKGKTLRRKHFSGRKTKLAHVNGMIGINVTEGDKERGVMRWNWVVRRSARFSEIHCCTVAGCLDCGCPVVCSVF
jgi:hypothetical protein